VEVLSALRRFVNTGEVLAECAEEAIDDLALLRIIRHGHLDFATPAWELRQNVTAYDAMYLAFAESLDATVLTCDRPFGRVTGHSARIEVIGHRPKS
jgi:predicted nucleic acid-binding protein